MRKTKPKGTQGMNTGKWMMSVMLTASILMASGAHAGDLTPPGAPGATMHTLEEIYQKLTNSLAEVQFTQQRLANLEQQLSAVGTLQSSSGDMVLIPAGNFVMGACTNVGQDAFWDAMPQHTVEISEFYMDKYEVTSNLWSTVSAWAVSKGYAFGHIGGGKGGNHPVHSVDWYDAIAWCNARSLRDGFIPCYTNANGSVYTNSVGNSFAGDCNWNADGYRLPTEAEWEKAARGGVAFRRFSWGDANTIQHTRANYSANPTNPLYPYDTSLTSGLHPVYNFGGYPITSPVGSFAPNGYGLYDMIGNAGEWCWDIYGYDYYEYSPTKDPRGGTGDSAWRIMRGGSWTDLAIYSQCAYRRFNNANESYALYGFRCARGR